MADNKKKKSKRLVPGVSDQRIRRALEREGANRDEIEGVLKALGR